MRAYCSDCELIPGSRELEVTEVRFQVSDSVFSLSTSYIDQHLFFRWPFWLKLFSLSLSGKPENSVQNLFFGGCLLWLLEVTAGRSSSSVRGSAIAGSTL